MAFTDIRQKVLSGQIKLKKVALWVDRWEEWVMVQELAGDERAAVIVPNTNKKTGAIDVKNFYPHLAIASVRYPDLECTPDLVDVTEEVDGEEVTKQVPSPHLDKYPSDEERKDNPLAGMLIFRLADDPTKPDVTVRDSLNRTSGQALEQIAQIAAKISGLMPGDIAEKKGN